jgi:hypothetical protein
MASTIAVTGSPYAENYAAWRSWAAEHLFETDDAHQGCAAHAAVLAGLLGATTSDDSVSAARATCRLDGPQARAVASIPPHDDAAAPMALSALLDSGWRPSLVSGHRLQLPEGEDVFAWSPCDTFFWGKGQAKGGSLIFGPNPLGLILLLVTASIRAARKHAASQVSWRPVVNGAGRIVVTSRRVLRLSSDDTINEYPFPALEGVELRADEKGVHVTSNKNHILYRVPEPRLLFVLLSHLREAQASLAAAAGQTKSNEPATQSGLMAKGITGAVQR